MITVTAMNPNNTVMVAVTETTTQFENMRDNTLRIVNLNGLGDVYSVSYDKKYYRRDWGRDFVTVNLLTNVSYEEAVTFVNKHNKPQFVIASFYTKMWAA